MHFQRIIEAVYFQPWNITMNGWRAIHAIVKPHLALPYLTTKPDSEFPDFDSPDKDLYGNPFPQMDISPAGVATIPIIGPLIHHASLIEKKCGASSYDDIRANVKAAMFSEDVRKIRFEVDSPGGMCMGCSETAALIDEAALWTPCEAVTDSLMCSAAYDLVAGCQKISCTPTAVVGSIGSILPWLDETVRYEMEGLRVEVFASGPLKGTGVEGTSLTPAQRDYLQSHVDKYAALFKDHVRSRRPVSEETMQGQAFIGSDALAAGLVDAIV